jgi:hypothetical protein
MSYTAGDGPQGDEAQVLNEIAYFEARLSAMGYSGDCAYEKSLARTYQCLLRQRRRLLDELREGRGTGSG